MDTAYPKRLMLALKQILASAMSVSTMVDKADVGVGGRAAALMLAADRITPQARENARELLRQARLPAGKK
ncbi:MAG: hypothetical protein HQL56_00835 [Magnetococcales bacterium]|nr:hypothetical protein [Magnetococcales bacterium]